MWTKSEDLQNKYVKLSSQQDYETVTKVLHEFGFEVYKGDKNDKYYEQYPFVKIKPNNVYYLYFEPEFTEIPIQQFYDYLASKILKVEDLVEGEIYSTDDIIFKSLNKNLGIGFRISNKFFVTNNYFNFKEKELKAATSEEKKWLNVCIKQNKFIPKEDLHLYDDITFELKSQTIPEYVECVEWNGYYCKAGEIYPIIKYNPDIKYCVIKSPHTNLDVNCNLGKFKFSTKEAYEAQNKVPLMLPIRTAH